LCPAPASTASSRCSPGSSSPDPSHPSPPSCPTCGAACPQRCFAQVLYSTESGTRRRGGTARRIEEERDAGERRR
jgi:hypothetical protein